MWTLALLALLAVPVPHALAVGEVRMIGRLQALARPFTNLAAVVQWLWG